MICIDLYPGELAIENVPAEFSIEDVPGDEYEDAGKWATLESIQIGGLTLPRDQVLLMVGCKAVCAIEAEVSERLSNEDAYDPLPIAAE